ncbi:hypothetical protein LK494_08840 [Anaerovorax odorimutans]|nr:hypothetical protein [Anaerovorax odorimutans]
MRKIPFIYGHAPGFCPFRIEIGKKTENRPWQAAEAAGASNRLRQMRAQLANSLQIKGEERNGEKPGKDI